MNEHKVEQQSTSSSLYLEIKKITCFVELIVVTNILTKQILLLTHNMNNDLKYKNNTYNTSKLNLTK